MLRQRRAKRRRGLALPALICRVTIALTFFAMCLLHVVMADALRTLHDGKLQSLVLFFGVLANPSTKH